MTSPKTYQSYFEPVGATRRDERGHRRGHSLAHRLQTPELDEPWPFRGLFDAIFCRNVMIYFRRSHPGGARRAVHAAAQPGLLALYRPFGSRVDRIRGLELVGRTVYRRIA